MNRERHYQVEFKEMGEEQVRKLLAQGRLNESKTKNARHWLATLDRERSVASQAENAELARSAALAARNQAEAAREANVIAKQANTTATLALIAAAIAIAISIIGLFLS